MLMIIAAIAQNAIVKIQPLARVAIAVQTAASAIDCQRH